MSRKIGFKIVSGLSIYLIFVCNVFATISLTDCENDVVLGNSYSNSWEWNSCPSVNRFDYRDPYNIKPAKAKYFTFQLDRDADIKVFIVGGFGKQLFLLEGDSKYGTPILSNQGSLIETWLPAGTYTVEATSFGNYNFTIDFNYNDLGSEECVQAIELGQDVEDYWVASCESQHRDVYDPYSPAPQDYFRAKYFTFDLTEDADVSIKVESGVDTYLYLLQGAGEFGVPVANKAGDEMLISLTAGQYTVEVTTQHRYAPGSFTLNVKQFESSDECNKPLGFDVDTTDSWSSACEILSWDDSNTDPYVGINPQRANYYSFSLEQVTDIKFTKPANDDSLVMNLYFDGDYGVKIATNFKSAWWGWPEIEDSTNVRLDPGQYVLEITRYNEIAIGEYGFNASKASNSDCQQNINTGTTLRGALLDGCYSLFREGDNVDPYGPRPGEYYGRQYSFSLSRPESIRALVRMDERYAYLYLAKQQDGVTQLLTESFPEYYWSSNKRQEILRKLDPGNYILDVTTKYPETSDDFSISLSGYSGTVCEEHIQLNTIYSRHLSRITRCSSEFKAPFNNFDPYAYGGGNGYKYYYAKVFNFEITEAGQYDIEVASPSFANHLTLVDGPNIKAEKLLEQEQLGSSANQINRWFDVGYYSLEVTSRAYERTGNFTLFVSNPDQGMVYETELSYPCVSQINISNHNRKNLYGSLVSNCQSLSQQGYGADYYEFTVAEEMTASFLISASSFSPDINLLKLSDDVWLDHSAPNSLIFDHSEQFMRTLEPGRYRIEATSRLAGSTGSYEVVIKSGSESGVDTDNDGVGDSDDAFPANAAEYLDSDGDGIGDNTDPTPFPLPEFSIIEISQNHYEVSESAATVDIEVTRTSSHSGGHPPYITERMILEPWLTMIILQP